MTAVNWAADDLENLLRNNVTLNIQGGIVMGAQARSVRAGPLKSLFEVGCETRGVLSEKMVRVRCKKRAPRSKPVQKTQNC